VVSLLLILVAVALLVLGLTAGSSLLLTSSIAASLLAAVALMVGARQASAARAGGRKTRAGRDGRGTGATHRDTATASARRDPERSTTEAGENGWRQPPGSPASGAGGLFADEPPAQPVQPTDLRRLAGLETAVHVMDGRPRYHLADCRHLRDRPAETLTVAEAVGLGFSPCGWCRPVTALLAEQRPV